MEEKNFEDEEIELIKRNHHSDKNNDEIKNDFLLKIFNLKKISYFNQSDLYNPFS